MASGGHGHAAFPAIWSWLQPGLLTAAKAHYHVFAAPVSLGSLCSEPEYVDKILSDGTINKKELKFKDCMAKSPSETCR